MNKTSLVLSILLAGMVIVCGLTYRQYSVAKAELLESRKQSVKLSDFNRLSEQLSRITGERAKAAKRMVDLNGEILRLNTEQAKCAGLQERIAQLQETQERKDTSIKALKSAHATQLADLSRELSGITEERAKAAKRMVDLNGEISRLKKEQAKCAGLQERIAQLQETQERKDASIKALQSAHATRLADLSRELSDITGERAKAAKRIVDLNGEILRLNTEQAKCAGLQERIAQMQETQDRKDTTIKELQSAHATQLANLSRELSDITGERAKAAKRIGDLNGEILRLNTEQAKCAGSQERMQGLVAQLKETQDRKDASIKALKSTYDALLIDLKNEIQAKDITVNQFEEKLRIRLVNRVLFAEGSARITPEGRRILGQLGQILKKVKDKYIYIVGHTDDVPISSNLIEKFPSNWELSAARAAAVVRFLIYKGGISPEIFAAVGRSFYQPVGSNKSDEGRAQNRRAEIIIANSLGLKPQ